MSEKKRTVRKREFVIQTPCDTDEMTANRWEDVAGGFADTAAAKRGIREKNLLGKFRIVAVCEEVEAKEVTEKKIVFG